MTRSEDAPSASSGGRTPPDDQAWWRSAVVYEVYLRSFADGDGDGVGDIPGLTARLGHLSGLGVDAIWVTPWYRSPMADGGYDIADHRDVDPLFGDIGAAQALIDGAHAQGLRLILDIVPNHTSVGHPWFQAALAGGPGSAARRRYLFRDGRGPAGSEPPNDWPSAFGGPAWTRVTEPDGRPGQWYLHLFAPQQPDLDWTDPMVGEDLERTLRAWFDRGVDGFRIDVAMGLVKHPSLPDLAGLPAGGLDVSGAATPDHPYYDRDGVHEVWRRWRAIADGYQPPRILLGEVARTSPERLTRYLRPDELHVAFGFDFLQCPWDARALREVIDRTRDLLGSVGAPATWVMSSHDETRHLSRLGLPDTTWRTPAPGPAATPDLAIGTRRARAAALLMLALPGSATLFQGEELGLWDVADLPDDALRDPTFARSGGAVRGRDGCRVPLPWSGDAPPFGFGPPGSQPWLPQPVAWHGLTVAAQEQDPGSMLHLYRRALAIRRSEPGLRSGGLSWCPSPPGTLLFERGDGIRCAVNLSGAPMPLPADRRVLVGSSVARGATLPPDAAEWFRMGAQLAA